MFSPIIAAHGWVIIINYTPIDQNGAVINKIIKFKLFEALWRMYGHWLVSSLDHQLLACVAIIKINVELLTNEHWEKKSYKLYQLRQLPRNESVIGKCHLKIPAIFDSAEFCSQGFNKQYSSIVSDNGLAPTRRQSIIWTNDGLVYWRIYASLGLNDLTE